MIDPRFFTFFKNNCIHYLFNKERALVYRGRLDSSSPGNSDEVDGRDLRKAIDLTLDNKDVKFDQFPSMGCNIKWK